MDEDALYNHAQLACDEAAAACDAILSRSLLWCALHPLQTRRLKRSMYEKRDAMRAACRAHYIAVAFHA